MDSEAGWNSGYVTELEYTHGYFRELSPGLLRLACINAGIHPPGGGRYLELACGQGLSINIHAAGNAMEFWGNDFNPTHIAHARAFAEVAGSEATLLDDSFAELADRPDLPEFDIIALHGIWSWVADEHRKTIVDIIRRKLRVGGVVYVSYNCLPGWAPTMPLRHLMKLHADLSGESGGILSKLDGALAFAGRVVDSGAMYFRGYPIVAEKLKRLPEQNRNYLAHEYLTQDFHLMAFSDVVNALDHAKVSYATTAQLLDHLDIINILPDGQKLLAEIKNPILKESVRDYFVSQQFRRDVFVKGPRRLLSFEQKEMMLAEKFVLTHHPEDIPLKVKGVLGEANLAENTYRPIIDFMAEDDFAPKTLEQIAAHGRLKGLEFSQVLQAVLVLTGSGHAHPAQESTEASRTSCQTLNRHMLQRARNSTDITYLASPITGGGEQVPRFFQLFLLGLQEGKSEAELATFAWNLSNGQRVLKDGKPLETAEESVAELTSLARVFTKRRLPIIKALQMIP
jgi:hypothetical protein